MTQQATNKGKYMFTLDVDGELKLALVQPSFAKNYLEIVTAQQEYLSEWLVWPPHGNSEAFFLAFIRKSLLEYSEGKGRGWFVP
ncbi:protein of unknown function [Vibrio tapetis subsp. tapetis]|uniref:Uncharacterized protein n=1 Tax=Vibrio tapetis subsp. tapetis TaxID=1671868 RepID=A0A2N8Z984_9VIBR|nr:protein of unknown function [Vibrio tapetis subsp. tapetis]